MSDYQDTEITLGTGRLLGLFFGFVLVCGIFFGIGFTMGRSAAAAGGPITTAPAVPSVAVPTGAKPTAGKDVPVTDCPAGQNCTPASSAAAAPADAAATAPAPEAQTEAPKAESAAAPPHTEAAVSPAAEVTHAAAAGTTPQPGFVVQIAAVSKKEDADTLLGALRKKSYPVFLAPDTGDHLFHVQIGPFADRKEAQAMKEKLAGDGYNAIVK